MRGTMAVLPWLLPGFALSIVVGYAVRWRVGRYFAASSVVAWGLIAGFGLTIAATLTPLDGDFVIGATVGTCDLSRIAPASFQDLVSIGDTSLNVLLFVPLGFALGLIPESRRRNILVAMVIALPFAIESSQLMLPVLGRGCQSADVADNLTGLFIGALIGTGARILGSGSGPNPD